MSGLKGITRRRLLGLPVGTVGATALGCCGLTVLGARTPEIEMKQLECGGRSKMRERILVVYATKAGSTGEVAEAIGQVLCGGGAAVDVRSIEDVGDVSDYSGVVVGSAIRIGRWLPEAVKFVEANAATLATMPVAYFQVSGFMQDDTPEKRQEAVTYLALVRTLVEPVNEGVVRWQDRLCQAVVLRSHHRQAGGIRRGRLARLGSDSHLG
jgi:menaquinone-dependent protoporphyrinogen oxidase